MNKKLVFSRGIALFTWLVISILVFDVRKDSSLFFDQLATDLLKFGGIRWLLSLFTGLGYLSVSVHWLATKLFFVSMICINIFIISLFFSNDRKVFYRMTIFTILFIMTSFTLSIISKFTGIFAFQRFSYSMLTFIIYPIAPFIFIPLLYMLSLESKSKLDVEFIEA
ncbi:hypothetical protein [Flammeovirga sp. OC4]|uniref:hypothetical protein n=1 Tax=Flammeovirga sp. OC4 TaxID=1382345 RepID=UPI0005C45238|nr:hypothetical protein [Flammeovirga sp. OC4]